MNTKNLTAVQLARLFAASHAQHSVSILIPSTNNAVIAGEKLRADASPALRAQVLNAVCKLFAKRHGGYALRDSVGGWIDADTGDLVEELGTTVTAFTADLTPDIVNELVTLAHSIRQAFSQDAVLITIDHAAWFIAEDTAFPIIG
jgi:hypothetical protein